MIHMPPELAAFMSPFTLRTVYKASDFDVSWKAVCDAKRCHN